MLAMNKWIEFPGSMIKSAITTDTNPTYSWGNCIVYGNH